VAGRGLRVFVGGLGECGPDLEATTMPSSNRAATTKIINGAMLR